MIFESFESLKCTFILKVLSVYHYDINSYKIISNSYHAGKIKVIISQ